MNETGRKLVLTIAVGATYKSISKLTQPSLKAYAKRIGAEFFCINEQKISKTTPHWEKFQIHRLLDTFERIAYIDTDILIRRDCPDLFEEVPRGKLGMFNEAKFTDRSKELMIDICKSYNVKLSGWDGKYYNSGVIIISQNHKELFKKPDMEVFSFYEQSYLNMKIAQMGVEIHDLDYKFNRMACMDRFTGESRYASYVMHYAGYPSLEVALELIEKDLKEWNSKTEYKYKRHLYIAVTGGLGDQICAEPAVRYLKQKLYPDDNVVVGTHWPRIFQHLEDGNGFRTCEHGKADLTEDTAYYIAESLPSPESIQWFVVSHLLCSSVDYTSIALMKRTLPLPDKTIRFDVSISDYEDLEKIAGIRDFEDYVVVHPGRHWETKTFPDKWWQGIIDGLHSRGDKVCVVGKTEDGDPPDYKAGARGTVGITCPEGVVDLRDKLELGAFGALLSRAKTLISNDSAPIHLAGAFDIEIVVIPTCKHPDHLLPWRHGSQKYKTKALYKSLIVEEVESRPTQVYETSVDIEVSDWGKYLLDPLEVVENV